MSEAVTGSPPSRPRPASPVKGDRRVLTRAEVRALVRQEHVRAEAGGEFAVVLFRVKAAGPKGRSLLSAARLAGALLRVAREADAVGWFDKRHLCVVMPGVSAAAATLAAARVCDAMGRGGRPRPRAVACGYPARSGARIDRLPVV